MLSFWHCGRVARQSSAKACTAVRIRSVPQTPPFQEGFFIQYCFFIFMLMEKAELIILQFTLLPIVAWVFLWGYDKLEHVLLHKYFEWTLRVERPQRPLKESFKKLFRSLSSRDFKNSAKLLNDISRSGFLKFVLAYAIGVGLVQLGTYGWLKVTSL